MKKIQVLFIGLSLILTLFSLLFITPPLNRVNAATCPDGTGGNDQQCCVKGVGRSQIKTCNEGFECKSNTCKPEPTPVCGQKDQDCCNPTRGLRCEGGLTCNSSNKCTVECGQNGQACCPSGGSFTCFGDNQCNPDTNQCGPKPTPSEGGEGLPCRTGITRGNVCDGGLVCVNRMCTSDCGTRGKICCSTPGSPQGSCTKEPNLECSKDNKCTDAADPTLPPPPKPPCADDIGVTKKCNSFFTAFNKINTNPGGFISSVFGVLLAVSGAIALLLILRAGYRIMLSEGNPERVKEGRDQLIAALVGLLFLIFSLVFLQLIGVDILKIPGWGGEKAPETPKGLPKGSTCNSGYQDPSIIVQAGCEKGLKCDDIDPAQCRDDGCMGTCIDDPAAKPKAATITSCSGSVLQMNSTGDCVETLQRALGFPDDQQSGKFEDQTAQAVVDYQTNQGLKIDGIVGSCTWKALKGDAIPESCKR